MTNIVAKFRRHANKPYKMYMKCEDGTNELFEFKPIDVNDFVTMMLISEKIESGSFGKDMIEDLFDIYRNIITKSYPEMKEETELVDSFIIANFKEFMSLIDKLSPEELDEDKKKKLMDRIKQMQQNKSAQNNPSGDNKDKPKNEQESLQGKKIVLLKDGKSPGQDTSEVKQS